MGDSWKVVSNIYFWLFSSGKDESHESSALYIFIKESRTAKRTTKSSEHYGIPKKTPQTFPNVSVESAVSTLQVEPHRDRATQLW